MIHSPAGNRAQTAAQQPRNSGQRPRYRARGGALALWALSYGLIGLRAALRGCGAADGPGGGHWMSWVPLGRGYAFYRVANLVDFRF